MPVSIAEPSSRQNTDHPGKAGFAALVVAAGRGTRLAVQIDNHAPKQYLPLGGQPIIRRTIAALLESDAIDLVLPVIHADDRNLYEQAILGLANDPRLLPPVIGGATRQVSVLNGLKTLADHTPDFVLIHDAVRPFITPAVIDDAIRRLRNGEVAVVAAVPVSDTLKRESGSGRVGETVARNGLWAAQTPQGFAFQTIMDAHLKAAASDIEGFTDDAAIAEWAGIDVALSKGDSGNTKITTASDLMTAQRKAQMEDLLNCADIRVGNGYDVHAFEPGDAVMLGGVAIPHDRKLKGHSDADVVLHALTDAVLGALGDGDIGHHFPPSEARWRNAASARFLEFAIARVAARGGMIANLDATIVCEAPKIGPHRDAIRASIAAICGLCLDRVSVKATTTERLGFTGRKEGIATLATATIRLPL